MARVGVADLGKRKYQIQKGIDTWSRYGIVFSAIKSPILLTPKCGSSRNAFKEIDPKMETIPSRKWIFVLLLLTFMLPYCRAQEQNAQVTGRVLDSTGAAIPKATVTLVNTANGFNKAVTSNDHGEFTIPLVPPADHYTLSATKTGFATSTKEGIALEVAETSNIDLTLKPGSDNTTITVSSDDITLDTQTSSVGAVIDGDTIQDIPLNGRSSYRLIELTPGVTFSNSAYGQFGDVPVDTRYDSNFSINGGRTNSNIHLMDGVPTNAGFMNQNTVTPTVGETQQFRVESSNLSAEYGRFGGGVINVSTRSGTDSFHGEVFEFVRNSVFDASDWFNSINPNKSRPSFMMNQFGGTVGGPVDIPHVYHGKDKTFFFFSYQGTRRVQGNVAVLNTVTDAEKNGDFSASGTKIFNPYVYTPPPVDQRTQFTYNGVANVIPPSMINPLAQMLLQKYYPEPNVSGTSGDNGNYITTANSNVSQNIYSIRIDQNISARDHLFGHYESSLSHLQQPIQTATIADGNGATGPERLHMQAFALNNTLSITPTLLLSMSYGFARFYHDQPTLSYGFDVSTFGTPGWAEVASKATVPTFPALNLANHIDLGGANYIKEADDTHSLMVQFTKVWGKHDFVFGYDGELRRLNTFDLPNPTGSYTFNPQITRINDTIQNNGNDAASFLLGLGASGSIQLGYGSALQDMYTGLYVQDNYRILPTVTLNVGVRYDLETPWVERHDGLNFFDFNAPSAAANSAYPNLKGGLVFANTDGIGRAVQHRDHANIVPRFGMAWSPSSNVVFRGAFSMVYAPLEISSNQNGFVPNQGYSATTTWNSEVTLIGNKSATPGDSFSNPFPNGLLQPTQKSLGTATGLGQAINVWDRYSPTPYSEQYSLSTQYILPKQVVLNLAYVGSSGVHLTAPFDHDTLPFSEQEQLGSGFLTNGVANPFYGQITVGPLAGPSVPQRDLLLAYPQFQSVTEVNSPWGHSTYNAGQVLVQSRQRRGLTIGSSFTWSKWISNISATPVSIGATNTTNVQDYYNLRAERSISDLDLPFHFLTHFNYSLPFGRGQKFLNRGGWLNDFLGDWKLAGIWMEHSGLPNAITTAPTEPGYANRPNIVLGVDPEFHGNRSNGNRVGGPYCDHTTPCGWINKAAFMLADAFYAGTTPRTIVTVRKPAVQNLDISLLKSVQVTQKMRFELRVEAFNITNTPHFGGPIGVFSDGNFGQIQSVRQSPPPRQLQFAGRFFF